MMLTALLLIAGVTAGVGAPSFAFDTDCAVKLEVLSPDLQSIVAIENRGVLGTKYGDRGFQHDLNGDGRPELFLLLSCSTSNCEWAIFEQGPLRDRGRVWGEVVYIVPSKNTWPTILAVGRQDKRGWSSEYNFDGETYVQGDVSNLAARDLQRLLERMGSVRCK